MMVPRHVDTSAPACLRGLAAPPKSGAHGPAETHHGTRLGALRHLFGFDTFERVGLDTAPTRGTTSLEARLGLDVRKWGEPVAHQDGVTLWKASGKPLPIYCADGVIDAPLDLVAASLVDINTAKPWLGCDHAGVLARDPVAPGQHRLEAVWYMQNPIPHIGSRLTLAKTSVQLHPETKQVQVITRALDADAMNAALKAYGDRVDQKHLAQMRALSDTKHMKKADAKILLTALPNGKTRMTVSLQIDPNVRGLSLVPGSIKDGGPRDATLDQIIGVRKRLQHPELFEAARQEMACLTDWSAMTA